jgi:hypothetical protein
MLCEILWRFEGLGTYGTFVILLVRVRGNVLSQHGLRFASVFAKLTRKHAMTFLVFFKSRPRRKTHVTDFATPWLMGACLVHYTFCPAGENSMAVSARALGLIVLHGVMTTPNGQPSRNSDELAACKRRGLSHTYTACSHSLVASLPCFSRVML